MSGKSRTSCSGPTLVCARRPSRAGVGANEDRERTWSAEATTPAGSIQLDQELELPADDDFVVVVVVADEAEAGVAARRAVGEVGEVDGDLRAVSGRAV